MMQMIAHSSRTGKTKIRPMIPRLLLLATLRLAMHIANAIVFFLSVIFSPRSVVLSETITCDFEIDDCAWTLNRPWRIFPSGSTPETASSGPTMDHTTGSGKYARFVATALLDTEVSGTMNASVSLANDTSFTFWYFMHGTRIGTLALLVNNETEWEKSGRQGAPAWYQANVILPAGEDIQLTFVASRPELGRSSDIAMDDFVLQNEPMPVNNRTTRPPASTTPRPRYNASCDFDVDKELCGWKSDTVDVWNVIHERDIDINYGPASDYSSITRPNNDAKFCKIPFEESKVDYYYCTPNKKVLQCKGNDNKWINCRDGGFVQIRTTQLNEVGERSQFESPVLDALSEEGCVQFQYNIAGNDNDWLSVYVEDYWTGARTCMWHANESSVPDRWMAAESPLPLEKDGKYKIVFEVEKSQMNGTGLVSLDHIVISPQRCSGELPMPACFEEETSTATTVTESTAGNPETSAATSTAQMTSAYEEWSNSTLGNSKDKDSSIIPIVAGVVGGVVGVALLVALFIWRKPILIRLGLRRSNQVGMSTTYRSGMDGAVEINVKREDEAPLF